MRAQIETRNKILFVDAARYISGMALGTYTLGGVEEVTSSPSVKRGALAQSADVAREALTKLAFKPAITSAPRTPGVKPKQLLNPSARARRDVGHARERQCSTEVSVAHAYYSSTKLGVSRGCPPQLRVSPPVFRINDV